jgi:hypothetical protein
MLLGLHKDTDIAVVDDSLPDINAGASISMTG